MKKVSVIVCTYNQENYILGCLMSILQQEVDFEMEILVGDDCSTDGTKDILDYFDKHYDLIHVYRRKRNLGASRNAYELVMSAQGEYLAFCEGDDFWIDKRKLQKQISFLDNHMEYIGCSHRIVLVNEMGEKIRKQNLTWLKKKRVFCLDDFEGVYLPGQTASIVKRNIFLDKNRDYSFLFTMNPDISDRTSTLLYLKRGKFYVFQEKMSAYRICDSGNSITKKWSTKNYLASEIEYTDRLVHVADDLKIDRAVFNGYYTKLSYFAYLEWKRDKSVQNQMLLKTAVKRAFSGKLGVFVIAIGFMKQMIDKSRRL